LVAGIVNRNSVDKEKVADLHFVAYEVIQPTLKPSLQMEKLVESGFETVLHRVEPDISNEMLSELLIDWRMNYVYEIDGVIVSDDKVYPRKASGNPDHSFAFKMVLSDQIAEAKVVNVLWTPSKDGYLKPRVQIEPVHLGGVTITYATGFNGAFIQENKIGVGAVIQIIRSGDVIPYIRGVTVPAAEAIETVSVVTNSFNAEQGMAGGAAMNVTIKSGTNNFHGALWEYHNNSALKARNYFYCLYTCSGDPNHPAKNIQNQGGFTFGGPVLKNKLFFFADYQGFRQAIPTSVVTASVFPVAWRNGDFSSLFTANNRSVQLYDPFTADATGRRQPDGFPERSLALVERIPAGLTVYCGHDQRSTDGRPWRTAGRTGGSAVFLDTGAGKGGHLSWIDLPPRV
jgi:hypothetical protein